MIKIIISDPDGLYDSDIFEITDNEITVKSEAIGDFKYPKTVECFIDHIFKMIKEKFNVEIEKGATI